LVDESVFVVEVESVFVVDEPLSEESLSEVDGFDPFAPWSFL